MIALIQRNAEKHGKSEAKLNTVGLWRIDCCDTLEGLRDLPTNSVHCCVTSPPYFGLRDYGMAGQIGLEPTPQEYVARMVGVFEEVRRVLREDGTFWLNVGDSYSNDGKWGGATGGKHVKGLHGSLVGRARRHTGLKPKDLIGIPWMLAFALRDAGWYLRSEIIWHKLAPMPESVRDRPTKAHEQVFLLTKSPRYFYDHVGSAEKASRGWAGSKFNKGKTDGHLLGRSSAKARAESDTRNMRSVWRLSPESFKGAHFATMPTELASRCIVAGTSERGCCPACGKCWERVIEKNRVPTRPALNSKVIAQVSPHEDSPYNGHSGDICGNRDPHRQHITTTKTVGWKQACKCDPAEPVPCLVLDPFAGAGTTLMVARRLNCRAIGFELNPEYAEMARQRIRDDQPLFATNWNGVA